MSAKKRVAVLISGRGSNMRALIEAARAPDYPAQIALVLSNVETAAGLDFARDAGIETIAVSHKKFATREAFDDFIDARLELFEVEFVCLAGYMRILSDAFARKWEGAMINIHPSLLPAFPGTHVHERVLAAGVKTSGCTVHFVVPELDAGPIIAQATVPVLPGDTAGTLAARVLEEEHALYPAALKLVAQGKVALRDGRAVVLE
ncbi:MAG TPA: phosphoribosylglycinamide formyltransferase [Rhizomicrobium sp.]